MIECSRRRRRRQRAASPELVPEREPQATEPIPHTPKGRRPELIPHTPNHQPLEITGSFTSFRMTPAFQLPTSNFLLSTNH